MVESKARGIFGFLGATVLFVACTCAGLASADISDPFDPFDIGEEPLFGGDDANKSTSQLILEAQLLLTDERMLDARTKLLRALQKDPKQYRAHLLLAGYYAVHVGHFRLADRYVRQGLKLFTEKYGPPPYMNLIVREEHEQFLYTLAQTTLDLDKYEEALQVLDEFEGYGYTAPWYAGSRAWVLMKLGRIPDAIKIARAGLDNNSEPGRTLNMLGILLSMSGQREASLEVFREAIRHEMSLGTLGQPATPLNNSGEVYKEIFEDQRAETSWLRATSMPDGCEHVLPALNLAILYMEQANYIGASQAMDSFESCVAQYPLRNGEEHRALVHLARGRVAYHGGLIDLAIKHLEASLEHRQWFGKIGTSAEDLEAGVTISLAQAYLAKNAHLAATRFEGWYDWAAAQKTRLENAIRARWLFRRAVQFLTQRLDNFEDLYIRNTDSLLEYPSLGQVTARLPRGALERRIELEKEKDQRAPAQVYYTAYLGENYLNGFSKGSGIELLETALKQARTPFDNSLRVHIMSLLMEGLDPASAEYAAYARQIFEIEKAAIWNRGLRLPINFAGDAAVAGELGKTVFLINNDEQQSCSVTHEITAEGHLLTFSTERGASGTVKVQGARIRDVVNRLVEEVFSTSLEQPSVPIRRPRIRDAISGTPPRGEGTAQGRTGFSIGTGVP